MYVYVHIINNMYRHTNTFVYDTVHISCRRDCETMSESLVRSNIPSCAYHGGMTDQERIDVQLRWVANANCRVSICDVACMYMHTYMYVGV